MKITLIAIALIAIGFADATKVYFCGTEEFNPDEESVKITGCTEPPCDLQKGTTVTIEQRFTPDHDIAKLTTHVYAVIILGIPLPFLGIDGYTACDKITTADGKSAGCPLKKGVEYIYRNSFQILEQYPSTPLTVHWALLEGFSDVTCFEVPAKIF